MNLVLLFLPVSIMAAQYLFGGSKKSNDQILGSCCEPGVC